MRVVAANAGTGSKTPLLILLGGLAALTLSVTSGKSVLNVALLVLLLSLLALTHRALLRWESLAAGVVLVIFFIPIKRYGFPVQLPFSLEPYRILVMGLTAAWGTSLLIDRKVRLRASGIDAPIALLVFSILLSDSVNGHRIYNLGVGTEVVKTLSFFASFLILFYIFVSVVRTRAQLDNLVKLLVASGSAVAMTALVEARTGYNVFNHLGQFIPVLQYRDPAAYGGLVSTALDRSGRLRAYASAAHPIELSAVLAMLLPLSLYLARRNKRWFLCTLPLALGTLATVSRTGVLMLLVVGLIFLFLRPAPTLRLWPALIPVLIVVHFALPQTLGSLRAAFFPTGGLIAEQDQTAGNHLKSDGRLADLGPSMTEFSYHPLFGEGFGTRIVSSLYIPGQAALTAQNLAQTQYHGAKPNARLLDDQWLGSLLETGVLGVFALLWLFTRSIRRLSRLAKRDNGDDGWLAVAFAASIAAFALSMLTFDALGFVQVTIVLFIFLALSSVLVRLSDEADGQRRLA